MNVIKINQGKVELRSVGGILQRIVCEGAQTADLSQCQKMVLVTRLNGQVDLRQAGGIFIRNISDGARDARFSGNDILVTKLNGQMELRTLGGIVIRRF